MKQLLLQNKLFRQTLASVGVFFSRINLMPANISPLGSFGFFGNPVLYAASILAFDLLVKGIYPGVFFTYAGFAAYPILGYFSKNLLKRQLLLLPIASFVFFLLSNLGVWWYWYDHTFAKLLVCYGLAVPFYARTLMSDVVFGYGYLAVKNVRLLKGKFTYLLDVQQVLKMRHHAN